MSSPQVGSNTASQTPSSLELISAYQAGRWICGDWLCPHAHTQQISALSDATLFYDDQGFILDLITRRDWPIRLGENLPYPSATHPGTIWLPGMIDTHVHYPQTAIIGSASGPLLDWLATSVFPEESRFSSQAYAERVASHFCDSMLSQGTTTAAIFSSSHLTSTDALFSAMSARGLGGEVGLTLMDRGAPEAVLCAAGKALDHAEQLIDRWHMPQGPLRFCVTPRFGLSCTPELLKGAGKLAQQHDLMVQTHLSENQAELVATAQAFPEAHDYLDMYAHYGLLHERSLFAHCIWLSNEEWDRFAQAGARVAHCPDSNFFLGSGVMSLDHVMQRQILVGLGSDVGAGRSFSMRKACARAYDASRISGSAVTPSTLLWLATRGGALTLNRSDLGVIEKGARADVVCIQPPPLILGEEEEEKSPLTSRSLDQLIAQLIFCEDWSGTREVYTQGTLRWKAKP